MVNNTHISTEETSPGYASFGIYLDRLTSSHLVPVLLLFATTLAPNSRGIADLIQHDLRTLSSMPSMIHAWQGMQATKIIYYNLAYR